MPQDRHHPTQDRHHQAHERATQSVVEGFHDRDVTVPELREARWIDLSRLPASSPAESLADAVAERVAAHERRQRPRRAAGMRTLRRRVGILLAGLLRAAFRGDVVSIHRRPAGGVWRGSVIGQHAAWGILDVMQQAGLVGVREGVRTALMGGDDPIFGGLPTRVWPTSALLKLAEHHGVSLETLLTDWKTNPEVERRSVKVAEADLVTVRALGREAPRLPVRPEQAVEAEAIRADVAALNASVAKVAVTGCPQPAFRRVFRLDLRLGGRFYAVGGSNFQTMPKADRALIHIGGEPVVEVDLHAAFLTLLLGVSGHDALPAKDLYAAVGLPRDAVKAWMVQTFATGVPAARWSREAGRTAPAANVKATAVRDAALAAYPPLADLERAIPADLLSLLPENRRGWAVGQYLTGLEARVMAGTLCALRSRGLVGLPMHDAVVVPARAAEAAADALREACWSVAKIEPRVKVLGLL